MFVLILDVAALNLAKSDDDGQEIVVPPLLLLGEPLILALVFVLITEAFEFLAFISVDEAVDVRSWCAK